MNESTANAEDRNNYVLFADNYYLGKIGIGLGISRLKISLHSVSEALGYNSTNIQWNDAISSMQSDIGKSLIPTKTRSVLGTVGALVVPGGMYASSIFGRRWNWIGAYNFDHFRVYVFRSMVGVIQHPFDIWVVSEEKGGAGSASDLFKAMLSHSREAPISDEEFEGKIANVRSGIKEALSGISMRGLDINLWHSL